MTLDDLIDLLEQYRREHPNRGSMRVALQVEYGAKGALAHPLPHPRPCQELVAIFPTVSIRGLDLLTLKFHTPA